MQRALCEAVAAVAERELPAGRWPQLLPTLRKAAADGAPRERTAALTAFAALAAAAPELIARDFADMQPALLAGLASEDAAARRECLEIAAAFIGALRCTRCQHEQES